MNLIDLAESGHIPDALIRIGIRFLLKQRHRQASWSSSDDRERFLSEFVSALKESPLALDTDAANRQHYEVPADFFEMVLGPRLKYSCCLYPSPGTSLADAEIAMLRETCEHAEIQQGQQILELGCGWGSLTLWMAEQYRDSKITAISNSNSQREFIEQRIRENGLDNVQVITADMRDFSSNQSFDRVVSVEMFEHMRNYELLLRRVSSWLHPDGKAFVHVFCHRDTPYLFETEGSSNWMGRHFFTGGMMPSQDLFSHFNRDLTIQRQWKVDGLHYWRTCEAWLKNADLNRAAILERFQQDLSTGTAKTNLQRWRIFFMACAELFRYRRGEEWFVCHYLMTKSPCDEQLESSERGQPS